MIVDIHQHVGTCRVFDAQVDPNTLIPALDAYGVDAALVMPFAGAPDARAEHERIALLGAEHPGRLRGIVCLNPHLDGFEDEAARCVVELGFVALKLHTAGHAVDPLSKDGQRVFAAARELEVAVIVHTGGVGEPFSSPVHVLPQARQYPDVSIVLAHAGMGVASRQAGIVAQECPNVYLEPSWCSILDTRWLVDLVGPQRIIFGSDSQVNIAPELAKFRALGLSEQALAGCLGETAAKVFRL
jgi:predicted TIM-barrel fold metal-dependent hydrolase